MWKKEGASVDEATAADWGPRAGSIADYVPYSAMVTRPPLTWPEDARIALWVVPNVECYEFVEQPNDYRTHYDPRLPQPLVAQYAYYDYGNRVGFWRMLDVLDRYGVRATASVNVAVLDLYPEIGRAMAERKWAYMGHGIYNTQFFLADGITEEEERAAIRDMIDTIERHTGTRMKGFYGPGGTVTPNTMDLIVEAGVNYTGDWFLDDQPFPVRVENGGKLVGLPYSIEVNDGGWLSPAHGRSEGPAGYLQACKDQFDTLYHEGADSGRVMCLPLHPWLIGRPHCVQYLDRALDYILGHEGVWLATGDEIADYYIEHHYDRAIAGTSVALGER